MHHSRKKRDLIRRTIIYIAMTVAVVILVGLCLFFVLGYSIDEKTGKTEQGGLVQFRSFPDTATVTVNGATLGSTTPTKSNQLAGYHSFTMAKKGYRTWSKNTNLKPGELLWLNALLLPKKITTQQVVDFPTLSSLVASPDRKWIIAHETAYKPELVLVDIRDEKKPQTSRLALPNDIVGEIKETDTFRIKEWDFGSRYVLVEHVRVDGTSEWLRVDRTDEKNTINISTLFNLPLSDMHFSGTSGNVLYALSGGSLRKFDIGQKTASAAIAAGVESFYLYKDNVLGYVVAKPPVRTAYYYKDGDKTATKVVTYTDDLPIQVSVAEYYDDVYVIVGHGAQASITKNPQDRAKKTAITTLTLPSGVQWVYFSYNGQFAVAQSGSSLVSYDLERGKASSFTIPGNPTYVGQEKLRWLDDFHFWSDQGGSLNIFEYDGSNPQSVSAIAPGYGVTLSDNGKRLFSVIDSVGGHKALQSATLVIE